MKSGRHHPGVRIAQRLAVLASAVLLVACAAPKPYDYSAYKAARPKSLLVLPPLNDTADVNATASVLAQTTRPLAESGKDNVMSIVKKGVTFMTGDSSFNTTIEAGNFDFSVALEDIHMNIEARLTELIGIAANVLYIAPVAALTFWLIGKFLPMRPSPEEEIGGLDIPEMGVHGYDDGAGPGPQQPDAVDRIEAEAERRLVDDEGHARSVNPQAHPAETIEPLAIPERFLGVDGLGLLMAEALMSLEGARCISLGTATPLWDIVLAAAAALLHLPIREKVLAPRAAVA